MDESASSEEDAAVAADGAASGRRGSVRIATVHGERSMREIALVLAARDVPFAVAQRGTEHTIVVAPRFAAKARRELARYAGENKDWPPHESPELLLTSGAGSALFAGAFLLTMFFTQFVHGFGLDWTSRGQVDGAAIRGGALERLVTALTLHADVVHVVSNVVFGFPVLAGLCQPLGGGIGLLLALLSGVAGNALATLLHRADYASLGASTAIFGAVGALVAYRAFNERGRTLRRNARLLLLAIGLAYFSTLGTGGERTDIVAHATGLVAGAALGAAAGFLPRTWLAEPAVQRRCGFAAFALIAGAWAIAIARD